MSSAAASDADPLGHRLLQQRLSLAVETLKSFTSPQHRIAIGTALRPALTAAAASASPTQPLRFVVTGTGSSEAHAKYLCYLLNEYSGGCAVAHFRNLSWFACDSVSIAAASIGDGSALPYRDAVLVVFSQGISANARIALRGGRSLFQHLVLFTSTTSKTAAQGTPKGDMLADLETDTHRVSIVRFPLEDEYTLLIRLVGPLCGYLASCHFTSSLFSSSAFASLTASRLDGAWVASEGLSKEILAQLPHIPAELEMIAAHPVNQFCQNLQYKWMEGVFIPCPMVWDPMSYAHGPFQQTCSQSPQRPRARILLGTMRHMQSGALHRLAERIKQLDTRASAVGYPSCVSIACSHLPEPFGIFELEMVMSRLVVHYICQYGINQISWPGKGLDGPLYLLDEPLDV